MNIIWVFNGGGNPFPSGVFSQHQHAEVWIRQHHLTGTLTAYPLDIGVYHWAIEQGHFKPKTDKHNTPAFIGSFSSAAQEHYHYENGECSGKTTNRAIHEG
jgi:hypothetical protein